MNPENLFLLKSCALSDVETILKEMSLDERKEFMTQLNHKCCEECGELGVHRCECSCNAGYDE